MPEDLKVSQVGSSPLPPPFRGLHSPGVSKHCQNTYLRLLFPEIVYSGPRFPQTECFLREVSCSVILLHRFIVTVQKFRGVAGNSNTVE